MALTWLRAVMAVDYPSERSIDFSEHNKLMQKMHQEASPHLERMGFEPTEHGQHEKKLEGGFRLHVHPLHLWGKDAVPHYKVHVHDDTGLADKVWDHWGRGNSEMREHFNEHGGVHPDLMSNPAHPASIEVEHPEDLHRAVHGLMRHPDTLHSLRQTMELRKRAEDPHAHGLAQGIKDHVSHHVDLDGNSDTRSVREQDHEDKAWMREKYPQYDHWDE